MAAKALLYIALGLGVLLTMSTLIAWHQHATISDLRARLATTKDALAAAVDANGKWRPIVNEQASKLEQCHAELAISLDAQAKALRAREAEMLAADDRAKTLRRHVEKLTAAINARCHEWAKAPVCVGMEAIP